MADDFANNASFLVRTLDPFISLRLQGEQVGTCDQLGFGCRSRGIQRWFNLLCYCESCSPRFRLIRALTYVFYQKHALRGFNVALMKELYDTPIRVTEIQPGLVETCETLYVINGEAVVDKLNDIAAFSITRFRGDESAAKKVYEGMQPLTAEDVAEDIVWAASRKPHMCVLLITTFVYRSLITFAWFSNVAETFVLPVNQASPTLVYKGGN